MWEGERTDYLGIPEMRGKVVCSMAELEREDFMHDWFGGGSRS